MPVDSLSFNDVGPFEEVSFDFNESVNVFTGPNNSGKSTVLWVLGEILVYPFGMPPRVIRSSEAKWEMGISSPRGARVIDGDLPPLIDPLVDVFEEIGFTCYVPAHRIGTTFRSSGPTISQNTDERLDWQMHWISQNAPEVVRQHGFDSIRKAVQATSQQYEGMPELSRRSRLMPSGETLISDEIVKQKIIDLDYAASRLNKPTIKDTIAEIATVASKITEEFEITFEGVSEDGGGLFPLFGTPDGKMPLDYLSQGTQSIIQFMAHILLGYAEYYDFPSDLKDKPGILIIDEIDVHLHPSWQRRVIPALTDHFPSLQIFCSTHSPLMLAGLDEGQIQLLARHDGFGVAVTQNENPIMGWSADEILTSLLNVRDPMDLATALDARRLGELSIKESLTDAEAEELAQLQETISKRFSASPSDPRMDFILKYLEHIYSSSQDKKSETQRPRLVRRDTGNS